MKDARLQSDAEMCCIPGLLLAPWINSDCLCYRQMTVFILSACVSLCPSATTVCAPLAVGQGDCKVLLCLPHNNM